MPTHNEVHAALDQLTASVFSGNPVFFTNQHVPKQSAAYVKQSVYFSSSDQFELGNTLNGRNHGIIMFQFHVPRNTGSALLNTWRQIVINSFRSKVVGGAVLQNARASANGETETWAIEQWVVPFYFDS